LVGTSEEKRSLGRATPRWEDNIKMDLKEIGLKGMDWIDMATASNDGMWKEEVVT
jgi:hypothetical protein